MKRDNTTDCRRAALKTTGALVLLVVYGLVSYTPPAFGAGNYLALKGGIYSPSAAFDLANVDVETTFEGDTKTGVNGELAIGRYVLPTVALELGLGYFKGQGTFGNDTATSPIRQIDFDVIPVVATVKAHIPAGPIAPYGELGIGAYFTDLDVGDNLNTYSGTTTFGLHTGAGLNVAITQYAFVGVEGRYIWANPSFGDQKITLNDTEYALNGFELNGFTTSLAFGFNF